MSERDIIGEINRHADLADIAGPLDDLAPVNLAAYAMEALQGRLPIEFVGVYLSAALDDHRCWIREHCPDDLKASAYALDYVLDEIRKLTHPSSQKGARLKLKRGRGRPKKVQSKDSRHASRIKGRGFAEYEKAIASGTPPKAARADAAKAAGMSVRNFERALQARRTFSDPEKLAGYLARGIDERRNARHLAAAKAQFVKASKK